MNANAKVINSPPLCRNPDALLALARTLGPGIVSADFEAGLAGQTPDPDAERITLIVHPVLSLLEWLKDAGWTTRLNDDQRLLQITSALMTRMAAWMEHGGQKPLVSTMSLVVRYLVSMADRGVNIRDRHGVSQALAAGIPEYRPEPGEALRNNTEKVNRERFMANYDRFFGVIAIGKPKKRGTKVHKPWGLHVEKGFAVPTHEQIRRTKRALSETEIGEDAPPLHAGACAAHAGLTVCAEQIALSPKHLYTALSLADNLAGLTLSSDRLAECATVAVSGIALYYGMPVEDALAIALRPTPQKSPAAYNPQRRCLTSYLAQGYYPAVVGRIPRQDAQIPLPARVCEAMDILSNTALETVGEAFGGDALTRYRDTVMDLTGWEANWRTRLIRLHAGWLYAAHHLCRLNPGVIQLLLGDVYGPYRAELNYLTVPESFLWTSSYRVHDKIDELQDIPAAPGREDGDPYVRVGKLAPSLAELAATGRQILAHASAPAEIAACTTFILQVHGRRPTEDHPHPGAYLIDCDDCSVFVVGDKNLGDGRRLKVVPASTASVGATTKSLRK
jgi:hypothetical protein